MTSTFTTSDAFAAEPVGMLPDLAAYPHLVCLRRIGVCTADGQHPLARVLEWFDRSGDVDAVSSSLGIPVGAVVDAIRYASELAGPTSSPVAGIASAEPVFGGSGIVTGPRDMDDWPRLVRTKDRVVRTAERGIPVSRLLAVFSQDGDIYWTARILGISPEAAIEALRYAQAHLGENGA